MRHRCHDGGPSRGSAAVPVDGHPPPRRFARRGVADPRAGGVIRIHCGGSFSPEHPPLLVVDGRLVSHDEMHALRIYPEMVWNIKVIKGQPAVDLYGPGAADGVVLITLKHPLRS
jgi:hypothetical protein